jgi:hypothetical protein
MFEELPDLTLHNVYLYENITQNFIHVYNFTFHVSIKTKVN